MRKIIAAGLALMTILLAGCDDSKEVESNDEVLVLWEDYAIERHGLPDDARIKILCSSVRKTDSFSEYDIPSQKDIGALVDIKSKDSFIAYDSDFNEIGLLERDGTYKTLVECDESRVMWYFCHNGDYLAYYTWDRNSALWLTPIEMGVYCFADGTSVIFDKPQLCSAATPNGVFIGDKFYYDIAVETDDEGRNIENIYSYDVKTKENKLVSQDVTHPFSYKGKLACVSEDKVVELSDDGSMTTLFSLTDMGLYRTIRNLFCSEDIFTYSYSTYDDEDPECATGGGVAFLKDGEKHFVAEEKACSYIDKLIFSGDNAVWYSGMGGVGYPMFYNIKKDQVMVLNAHKSNFYPLISKEAVYFVEMREQKPSIVEYKF